MGRRLAGAGGRQRSEEHTSELQSQSNFVCRLLLEKKNSSKRTPRPCATWTSSRAFHGPGLMKIALDAMGGDFAPEQVVAGGVQAHRELGVDLVFVGIKAKVDAALAASGAGKWAEIEDAPEVIAMDEHPV